MAHYKDFHSDPSKWKKKPLHVDFITTEFQKKEQDNSIIGQGRKRSLEERVQLREEESSRQRKKSEFVPKEVWQNQKVEEGRMKCKRSNYQVWEYKAPWRAKTPPFPGNTNQDLVQVKRKFVKVLLKITELRSEEDCANE